MVVKDVVQKTAAFFKEKGIESARLDAEILISRALSWPRIQLYTKFDYPMTDDELEACRASVRRRAQGEPVAYIVGERDFYGRAFAVRSGVLVPRPETEYLVQFATEFARAEGLGEEGRGDFRIVDFGCGSGCVGLSALAELPNARLLAIDLSPTAIEVTRENAARLGVEARVATLESDVADVTRADVVEALGGPADAVVANPPYVERGDPRLEANVLKHEPALALFSGEGGLLHFREWSARAADVARPGALVAFEIGAGQGARALALLQQNLFTEPAIRKDLAGHERVAVARAAGGD